MRKTLGLALSLATAASGLVLTAAPASACTAPSGGGCADTVLTVSLTGGTLSISAPGTASMSGSVAAGTVIGPTNMGASPTQVTDNRGTLAGWTVTALTTGNLHSALQNSNISLGTSNLTGPLALLTGVVTAGGSSLLTGVAAGGGGSLNPSQAVTVATAALGAGGGVYTYTPTLTLTVPANTVAATDYTTTITQSVQ